MKFMNKKKGKMGKLKPIIYAAVLTAATAFSAFAGTTAFAEGSRDIILSAQDNTTKYNSVYSNAPLKPKTDKSNWARWRIRNGTGYSSGVYQQQKFKFYAYEGEVALFACSMDGGISERKVQITKPDGTVVPITLIKATPETDTNLVPKEQGLGDMFSTKLEMEGPNNVKLTKDGDKVKDGYDAYEYPIDVSGTYEVQFLAAADSTNNSNPLILLNATGQFAKSYKVNEILAWDITVATPVGDKHEDNVENHKGIYDEYEALSGRVWADAFSLQTNGNMFSSVYAVTRDGYIWEFNHNGIAPYTYSFYANSRGNISESTNASLYHSIHYPTSNYTLFDRYKKLIDKNENPDGVLILGPDNTPTEVDYPYHMFFNIPDTSLPSSVVAKIDQDPKPRITKLYYDGRDGIGRTDGDMTSQNKHGYVGVGGYFEIETENATSYRIIIDMSNMFAKDCEGEFLTEDGKRNFNVDGRTATYPCGESEGKKHQDEICLSKQSDEKTFNAEGDTFVYFYNGHWYSIRTKDGDRHPTQPPNLVYGDNTGSFENYVVYQELDSSVLGNDLETGKKYLEEKGYKSLGKVMLGNSCTDGQDRIEWNGRDQYGRILPIGYYFGSTGRGKVYAQPKMGEIHFPLGDVEDMMNGVAIWLVNMPEYMTKKASGALISDAEQVKARSTVYYDNEEMSILRDFSVVTSTSTTDDGTGGNQKATINNLQFWNLSTTKDPGEKDLAQDPTSSHNYLSGETFEDASIDGVASYTGTTANKQPTLQANQYGSSAGADHGVADIWTYAAVDQQLDLANPIYLYHYANQKIITGFVFNDEPGTGEGKYDTMTNDHQLPTAKVTARYGLASLAAEGSSDSGEEGPSAAAIDSNPFEYTTTTSSTGYYSIPIRMDYFDPNDDVKEVEITVEYDDNEHTTNSDIATYKVTTAIAGNTQTIGDKPNKSVQSVYLGTKLPGGAGNPNNNATLKNVYAENVGYVNNKSNHPLRIQKIWEPNALRDPSMVSTFKVVGVLQEGATSPSDADFEDETKQVYVQENVHVAEDQAGVTVIDNLPSTTYTIDNAGGKSASIKTGQEIIYKVFEEGITSESVKSEVEHNPAYKVTGGDTEYDNWEFKSKINVTKAVETVWYDANQNGKQDGEETLIDGATVQIAKYDSTKGEQTNEDAWTDITYAPNYDPATYNEEEYKDKTLLETLEKEAKKTTGDNGEKFAPGTVAYPGLTAGTYRITVELPKDIPYNSATFTSNGEKCEGDEKVSASSAGTTVTQIFKVGPGTPTLNLSVGFGYAAGLSIRKNIDMSNASANVPKVFSYIKDRSFTFEVVIYDRPGNWTWDGDTAEVEVETFELNTDTRTEQPAEKDKKLTFKYDEDLNAGHGGSVAVFTLKQGERIMIPSIDSGTEYAVYEFDETTATNGVYASKNNDGYTDTSFEGGKWMAKGFTLRDNYENAKVRISKIPENSRSVTVYYTNEYEPVPVSVMAGSESEGITFTGERENDAKYFLDINALVKIESDEDSRTFKTGDDADKFKLIIKPERSDSDASEYTPEFSNSEKIVQAKNPGTTEVKAAFDNKFNVRYTEPKAYGKDGTIQYRYVVREAIPFSDEGVEPIPGITYASEVYGCFINVMDDGKGGLTVKEVTWTKKQDNTDKWISIDAPDAAHPLVFTNKYKADELAVEFKGTKTITGRSFATTDNFTFNIATEGVGYRRDDHDQKAPQAAPLPDPATTTVRGTEGTESNKAEIKFDPITFTEEMAGADEAHAYIYPYVITETEGSTGGLTYDTTKAEVYAMVYKDVELDDKGNFLRQAIRVRQCDKYGNDVVGGFSFTNSYKTDSLTLTLSGDDNSLGLKVTKQIQPTDDDHTARSLKATDHFKFSLVPLNTNVKTPDIKRNGVTDSKAGVIDYNLGDTAYSGDVASCAPQSGKGNLVEKTGLTFDEKDNITFDSAGAFTYLLTELNPTVEGSDLNQIAGLSYDNAQYRITVFTVDNGTGKIELDKSNESDKDGNQDGIFHEKYNPETNEWAPYEGTEIVFTNEYNPGLVNISLTGAKTLETTTTADLNILPPFQFKLTPVEFTTLEGGAVSGAKTPYNNGDKNMPMPNPPAGGITQPEDGSGSVIFTHERSAGLMTGSINISDIPFTVDEAGDTEDTAKVYHYKLEELKPATDDVKGITYVKDPIDIYVRVYQEDGAVLPEVFATEAFTNAPTLEFKNQYTPDAAIANFTDIVNVKKKVKDETGTIKETDIDGGFKVRIEPLLSSSEILPPGFESSLNEYYEATVKSDGTLDEFKYYKDGAEEGTTKPPSFKFTSDGTYEYLIREVTPAADPDEFADGGAPGYKYDPYQYKLKFEVKSDHTQGKLNYVASVEWRSSSGGQWQTTFDTDTDKDHAPSTDGVEEPKSAWEKGDDIYFVNTYKDVSVLVPITGFKALSGGKELATNDFKFTLEKAGYSTVGKSTLGDDGYSFENKAGSSVEFVSRENPTGKDAEELGTVEYKDGKVTVGNNDDSTDDEIAVEQGVVDFGSVKFTAASAGANADSANIYRFKITEQLPADVTTDVDGKKVKDGVTYDDKPQYIYIKVYKSTVDDVQVVNTEFCDASGKAAADDTNLNSFTFVNYYNASPLELEVNGLLGEYNTIEKNLTIQSGDYDAGPDDKFWFVLTPAGAADPMPKAGADPESGSLSLLAFNVNGKDLSVAVPGIAEKTADVELNKDSIVKIAEGSDYKFVFTSPGTYTYNIREINPAIDASILEKYDAVNAVNNVTYDTTSYALMVTVEDKSTGTLEVSDRKLARSSLSTETTDPEKIEFNNIYDEQYTLRYDGNGATFGTELLPPTTPYDVGETVKLTDPTKDVDVPLSRNDNEIFAGWSEYVKSNTDGGIEYYSAEDIVKPLTAEDKELAGKLDIKKAGENFDMPQRDVILYAVWAVDANKDGIPDYAEEDGFSVRYHLLNGGKLIKEDNTDVTETLVQSDTVFYLCPHSHVLNADAELLSVNETGFFTISKDGTKYTVKPTRDEATFIGWRVGNNEERPVIHGKYPTDLVLKDDTVKVQHDNVGYYVIADDDKKTRHDINITKEDGKNYLDVYAVWAEDKCGGTDPDSGDEISDGKPDYEQVTYYGNIPLKAKEAGLVVQSVPIDNKVYAERDEITLESAPTLEGYTFIGWCTVQDPNAEDVTEGQKKLYQAGEKYQYKSDKLERFYAQWTENTQNLILQVYDDANYSGIYEGESKYETILALPETKIVLQNIDNEEDPKTIEGKPNTSGGGIMYESENLPPGNYRVTITLDDESGYGAYDAFTNETYLINGITEEPEGVKAYSTLEDGTLKITHEFLIPADNFNGTVRYGVSRPHTVTYDFNGAPMSKVDFSDSAKEKRIDSDSDYAYVEGSPYKYPSAYDGKVTIAGKAQFDVDGKITPDSDFVGMTKYTDEDDTDAERDKDRPVYYDDAGARHVFQGWSTNPNPKPSEITRNAFVRDDGEVTISYEQIQKDWQLEMVDHDIVLYAIWDEPFTEAVLNFDANGGKFTANAEGDSTMWPAKDNTEKFGNLENAIKLKKGDVVELGSESEKYWPTSRDADYNDLEKGADWTDKISRENAVFIGWSSTKIPAPATNYNAVKDSILTTLPIESANTVYAVWAEDTKGKLEDSEGVSCDKPDHTDCTHGDLQKQASDGIPDYLQVFYDLNSPADTEIIGNSVIDPFVYLKDSGMYTLDLNSFSANDRAALGDAKVKAGETNQVYLRSSALSAKGYAFEGWTLNDKSGNTEKYDSLASKNGIHQFKKNEGQADTLYAVWRPTTKSVINVRAWYDENDDYNVGNSEHRENGFKIDYIKEVVGDEAKGSVEGYTEADTNEDNEGIITISTLVPGRYEMKLTVTPENKELSVQADRAYNLEKTINIIGNTKDGDKSITLGDPELISVTEGAADNSTIIVLRFYATELFSGDLYIRLGMGHDVTYDMNYVEGTNPANGKDKTGAYSLKMQRPADDLDRNLNDSHEIRGFKSGDTAPTDGSGYLLFDEEKERYYYIDSNGTTGVEEGKTPNVKYYFKGWNTDQYGHGEWYVPNGMKHDADVLDPEDVFIVGVTDQTFYAIWEQDTYKIYYHLNDKVYSDAKDDILPLEEGGNGSAGQWYFDKTYLYGEEAAALWMPNKDLDKPKSTVELATPTPDGKQIGNKIFIGWTTDKDRTFVDGSPKIFDEMPPADLLITSLPINVYADNTYDRHVYAVWAADENNDGKPDYEEGSCFVQYHANAGDDETLFPKIPPEDNQIFYVDTAHPCYSGETVALISEKEGNNRIRRDKKIIIGWSETPHEGIIEKASDLESIELLDSVTFESDDITVYAVWAYDIDENGKADYTETFTVKYDLNYADTPGEAYSGIKPPAARTDYNYNDQVVVGDAPTGLTKTDSGDMYYENAHQVKYYFEGWNTKDDGTGTTYKPGRAFNLASKSVTLYAVWKVEKFNITYNTNGGTEVKVPEAYTKDYSYNDVAALWMPSSDDERPKLASNPKVVFVGWTESEEGAKATIGNPIDTIADANNLLVTSVTLNKYDPANSYNRTVYAVWAVDDNEDKIPDYAGDMYYVQYDRNDGTPEGIFYTDYSQPRVKDQTAKLLEIEEAKNRVHRDKAVLIGWVNKAHTDVVQTADEYASLEDIILDEDIQFEEDANITVYALWAVDNNSNGKPDYEDKYTIIYNVNDAPKVTAPSEVTNIEYIASVETAAKMSGLSESAENELYVEDAATGKKYYFRGWSLTPTGKATDLADYYKAGDSLSVTSDIVEKYANQKAEIILYAVWEYGVEYNMNGGTGKVPTEYTKHDKYEGDSADVWEPDDSAKPARDAYVTFVGWSRSPISGALKAAPPEGTLVSGTVEIERGGVTLYAVWGEDLNGNGTADYEESGYKVRYDANGGTGTVPEDANEYRPGVTVNLLQPSSAMKREKAVFVGWTNEENKQADVYKTVPTESIFITNVKIDKNDVTVYAVWAADENSNGKPDYDDKYTLSYDLNLPTPSADLTQPDAKTAGVNEKVEVASINGLDEYDRYEDANGVHHTFLGWSENAKAAEAKYDPNGANNTITLKDKDITLYAVWSTEKYKVTYDLNDGSGEVDSAYKNAEYNYNEVAALWIPAVVKNESGAILTDERPTANKGNRVFIGWMKDDEEARKTVEEPLESIPEAGTLITSVTVPVGGATVYAAWALDANNDKIADYTENCYLLQYHANGGTPEDTKGIFFYDYIQYRMTGEKATLMSIDEGRQRVRRAGAALVGWSKTRNDNLIKSADELDAVSDLCEPLEEITFENEDVTIYAVWAEDKDNSGTPDYADKFTVKYDTNITADPTEGYTVTAPAAQEVNYNSSVDVSDIVSLTETDGDRRYYKDANGVKYYFIGWNTEKHGEGAEYAPGKPYTVNETNMGDVTLYAQWEAEKYTITYALGDGTNASNVPDAYKIGYNYNELAALWMPAAEDIKLSDDDKKVFVGWTDKPNNTVAIPYENISQTKQLITSITINPAGNKTVYAAWAVDKDNNDIPDYASDKLVIQYHANGGFPSDIFYRDYNHATVKNGTATLISVEEGKARVKRDKHVLIGWTAQENAPVITSNDNSESDSNISKVEMYKPKEELTFEENVDITVYAVWAEDKDDSGTPDYEDKYILTYDKNDGSEEVKQDIDLSPGSHTLRGDYFTKPGEGVVQIGWSLTPIKQTQKSAPTEGTLITSVDIKGNMTVYAVWAEDKNGDGNADYDENYTVTYDPNASNAGAEVKGRVAQETGLKPTQRVELTDDRYTASNAVQIGWSEEPQNLLEEMPETDPCIKEVTIDKSNVTVYAVWAIDKDHDENPDYNIGYKLTYDGNGVTENVPTDDYTYKTTEKVTLDKADGMTRENAIFLGWSLTKPEPEVITTQKQKADITIVKEVTFTNGNITVYAVWAENKNGNDTPDYEEGYSVTYNENGAASGTAPKDTNKYMPYSVVRLTAAPSNMKRENAVFVGWTKEQHTDLLKEQPTDVVEEITIIDGDITVYAAWAADENGNGKPDYNEGFKVQFIVNNPTEVKDNEKITPPEEKTNLSVGGTMVLESVTGSAMTDDGTYVDKNNVSHKFLGWSEDRYSGTPTYVPTAVDPDSKTGTLTINNKDIVLYGIWESTAYSVSYNTNGATEGKVNDTYLNRKYPFDTTVALWMPNENEKLKKTECVFVGWSERLIEEPINEIPEAGTIITSITINPAENKTVYAVWATDKNSDGTADFNENRHMLKYHSNLDGAFPNSDKIFFTDPITYIKDDEPGLIDAKTEGRQRVRLTNAVLIGWSSDPIELITNKEAEEEAQLIESVKFSDSDITVYAVWAEDMNDDGIADYKQRFTLTYDNNESAAGEPVTGEISAQADIYTGTEVTLTEETYQAETIVQIGWSLEKTADVFDAQPESGVVVTSVTVNEDMTVYAVWAEDKNRDGNPDYDEDFIIEYNSNEGAAESTVNGVVATERGLKPTWEVTLTKDRYTRAGAVQIGWSAEPEPLLIEKPDTDPCIDTLTVWKFVETVYAVWAVDNNGNSIPDYNETFTLTYNTNGAPGTVTAPTAQQELAYNAVVKAAAMTEANGLSTDTEGLYYENSEGAKVYFLGWAADRRAEEAEYEPDDEININSADVVLYAVWQYGGYKVNYDFNGGNGTVPDEYTVKTYLYNETAALWMPIDNLPARDGAVFVGWSEKQYVDLFAERPDSGIIVTSVTIRPAQDKTVYAVWAADANGNGRADYDENRYYVQYGSNGADMPQTDIFYVDYTKSYLTGDTAKLITIDEGKLLVSKNNAVLIGWSEEAIPVITDQAGEDAAECIDEVTIAGSDKTVYAVWAEDTNGNGVPDYRDKFSVTYDLNGGSGAIDETARKEYDEGASVTLWQPDKGVITRTNAVFIGWSTERYADIYTAKPSDGVLITELTMPRSGVTVYAVWAEDLDHSGVPDYDEIFRMKYDLNGGSGTIDSEAESTLYHLGSTVTLWQPEKGVITKSGAVFVGWSADKHEEIFNEAPADGVVITDIAMPDGGATVYAVWGADSNANGTPDYLEKSYTITYNWVTGTVHPNGVELPQPEKIFEGTPFTPKALTSSVANYTFNGWYTDSTGKTKYVDGTQITGDMTIYGKWTYLPNTGGSSGGGGGGGGGGGMPVKPDTKYTLKYETNGGSTFEDEEYSRGTVVDLTKVPTRDKYHFVGWFSDSALTTEIDYVVMNNNITVYASWIPIKESEDEDINRWIEQDKPTPPPVANPDETGVSNWLITTGRHVSFMHGYPDGSFAPDSNMTRAEMSQMFYNLLLNKDVETDSERFVDVPSGAWYATAVNTLAAINMVTGVGDNVFEPDRPVTRAEFTTVAMRFAKLDTSGENIFDDVYRTDWFYNYIIGSIKYGWITGYEDGTFRPNNSITRAEVTTIVDKMLKRIADNDFISAEDGDIIRFTDINDSHWAYYNVMEATNEHVIDNVKNDNGGEIWLSTIIK